MGSQPGLDVIRAAAVLLVVLEHAAIVPLNAGGAVGVSMFFALSGFLITALLLEECESSGRISLVRFYLRRSCRLLPALVVFLACMAVVARLGDAPTLPTAGDLWGALFYVGNYTSAMQGHDTAIVHTWSLAVEEQFYIVWPLVLIVVLVVLRRRMRHLAMVAVGLCGSAVALRATLWDGGAGTLRVYFGTDTRMDCLLVGALAAMWLHGRRPGRNHPRVAVFALAGAAGLSLGPDVVEFLVVPLLVPILTTVAIVCLVQEPRADVFRSRVLELIGRRSYGIYLWHFPLVGAAAALPAPYKLPMLLAACALTVAVVHLSWRCVEEPFLQLRTRWASHSKIDVDNSVEGLATFKTSL